MAKKIVIALSGGLVGGAGIAFLVLGMFILPSFPAGALVGSFMAIGW